MKISLFALASALLGSAAAVPVETKALSGPITRRGKAPCKPNGYKDSDFVNWRTFKANGANLGAWLAKEKTHDPEWWATIDGASDAPDEWTLCKKLGSRCGSVLEARYASFLNTTTIDDLARVGVNTIRITTTYAAWVKVPGSELYHGNQQQHLKKIADYAISAHNMHVVIGLHSLPGGVNNLDIGEAIGHGAWFGSKENLDWSWKAVEKVLDFIKASGQMNHYSVSPINEAANNMPSFGSAGGLTEAGSDWVMKYLNGVISRVEKVDKRIPIIIQDSFKGVGFWAPKFDAKHNIVLSPHIYYFAVAGLYSQWADPAICGQAQWTSKQTSKFPIFVGEWALQTRYNNSLSVDTRKKIFNTQRYAWNKYLNGGAFWTGVSYANAKVDGEGVQKNYWSYVELIHAGVIKTADDKDYC